MKFLAIFLIVFSTTQNVLSVNIRSDLFKQLEDRINSYQVLKEQAYRPPFKWFEKLGLYRSDIRINLFGNPLAQELRSGELTAIFDNDMFSTGWIITALLEANLYGKGAPVFDAKRLQLALETIGSYHNKNDKNYMHSLIRSFWPQIYNSTNGLWSQQPDNIRYVALNIEHIPWDSIEKILHTLGFENLIKYAEEFRQLGGEAIRAFCIPPDFDDTYLNLGLGATLHKLRSTYPHAYETWLQNNTDIDHLIEVTNKYSYKPFSSDPNESVIDPRTYFFARDFLIQSQNENKPLSLITTWIQNLDEQRKLKDLSISMPFNLNNVDVTVSANTIYGMTSAALFNINEFTSKFLNSPQMIQTYLNTTRFVSWAIKSNFTNRPDLAQVYYPSTYNFLWYASRTLFLIESEAKKMSFLNNDNLESVLLEAKSYLQDAFETKATEFLLNWQIKDGVDKTHFRDFIGLNDTNLFGKPESKNDDAIFSTAQAINILIATWTFQRPDTGSLVWKTNTPNEVKQLVKTSVNWLQENVFNKKFKTFNAFFSGSVKGFSSLPFWYPSNFVQFLNGTSVDPSSISTDVLGDVIYGVQGTIDEGEFEKMTQQPHFGVTTPIDFVGYNVKENVFPFWSSTPYTYAVSLLALSQYNNLE
ncbi:unnamed protein product [Brachionus calyciflorus]|uniref:Transmembrane protein n=1 Tax=Brachionus calyciflorus TaxID=104777 RepID=A0A814AF63_9BILA|nr:unnamed protein product [Brachionus calyciflorus]